MKIGDRVKQKYTRANRKGTVIGIWEEDEYIENNKERILFAVKGEVKVRFDNSTLESAYHTFSETELEIL